MTEQNTRIVFRCPVCGGNIHHERVDDGKDVGRITENGEYEFLSSKSNGHDRIFCAVDDDHEIPDDLHEAALEIADAR